MNEPSVASSRSPDFERIAALSSDGYFHAQRNGEITYANPGFASLSGLDLTNLLKGRHQLKDLVHPEGRADLEALVEKLANAELEQAPAVVQLIRPDGEGAWVELLIVAVRDRRGALTGFDGVARDVSEHLAVADMLSRVSLEQKTLLEVQRQLLTTLNFDDTLRSIVERAQELLGARIVTLFLLGEEEMLVPTATSPEGPGLPAIEPSRINQGVVGRAVADGEPRYIPDVAERGKTSPLRDVVAGKGSMLVAPLERSEDAVGALAVVGDVGQYSEKDLDFLVALAQVASLALVNSESFRAVERLATLDPLTSAFNRRFLNQTLPAELNRAQRFGYPLAVLMLDVDDLKQINDTYGHPAGDKVLRHVVNVCQDLLRETDWIARYGGDEFVVVLPGCEQNNLRRVGEKLRAGLVERPITLEAGATVAVRVSMGGAIKSKAWVAPEELIKSADRAERTAKRDPKNRLHIDPSPMQDHVSAQAT